MGKPAAGMKPGLKEATMHAVHAQRPVRQLGIVDPTYRRVPANGRRVLNATAVR